eukprot:9465081-Alexandrium_andersonii.AAC.1
MSRSHRHPRPTLGRRQPARRGRRPGATRPSSAWTSAGEVLAWTCLSVPPEQLPKVVRRMLKDGTGASH